MASHLILIELKTSMSIYFYTTSMRVYLKIYAKHITY